MKGERRLPIWRRDALDQQDKELGLGKYALVLCSDGRYRYKWQLAIAAASREAELKVKTHALHMGRLLYVGGDISE